MTARLTEGMPCTITPGRTALRACSTKKVLGRTVSAALALFAPVSSGGITLIWRFCWGVGGGGEREHGVSAIQV